MKSCAFLTMHNLTGFVTDDDLVLGELAARGWRVEPMPWRDRSIDWDRFDAVVVRSTWDYQADAVTFASVLATIESSRARLANELSTMRWNLNKTYLRELDARGVEIPPTAWYSGLDGIETDALFDALATDEIVIKPVIGANADDTYRLTRAGMRESADELARVFAYRDCIVQPFLPAVVTEGEFSLMYFNGIFSHAILKTPKADDFRVQEEHGGLIRRIDPEPALRAAADAAIRAVSPVPLYARADLVRSGSAFVLMELELIEPALYFRMDSASPARFAQAFDEWMARSV